MVERKKGCNILISPLKCNVNQSKIKQVTKKKIDIIAKMMQTQDVKISTHTLFFVTATIFVVFSVCVHNGQAQQTKPSSTALATTTSSTTSSASGACHLRELDLCAASLVVFMQAPSGLATTEQEINKQCVHIKEADQCLNNYTKRCMTPMQRQVVSFASNSSLQLANEYCTKGSSFRVQYLKHASCLNQVQKKEQKGCMRDLQAALELLAAGIGGQHQAQSAAGSMGAGKRLALACCTYRRFESCFGGQLEKRCGKDTAAFVQTTVRSVASRVPETVCRPYKHDSNECRALLPKSGTVPKGSKSNSIISRLMTAYSGL